MFRKYREDADYLGDKVNKGHLRPGQSVKIPNGKIGTVVHGNAQRSLIQYSAPPESGASVYREWFDNTSLLVEV